MTSFGNSAVFSSQGGEEAELEVSQLSELALPWKL